jgi:hypothetical protein
VDIDFPQSHKFDTLSEAGNSLFHAVMLRASIFFFIFWMASSLAWSQAASTIDDASKGRHLAVMLCTGCHVVAPGQPYAPTMNPPAASFESIAQRAGTTVESLRNFLTTTSRLARVAFIANPKFRGYEYFWRSAEPAAQAIAIELIPSQISNNAADIEHAIESFAQMPDSGLLFVPDATIIAHRDLVITLAARHRMPAVFPWRFFVTAGALMSYGIDNIDVLQKAASYVDRILRGAKPADLPVQAPTKFETAINLKTAKALGLTIPPTLIATADEVIE